MAGGGPAHRCRSLVSAGCGLTGRGRGLGSSPPAVTRVSSAAATRRTYSGDRAIHPCPSCPSWLSAEVGGWADDYVIVRKTKGNCWIGGGVRPIQAGMLKSRSEDNGLPWPHAN